MVDREKVIKGLECCAFSKQGNKCEQCPYFSGCVTEYGAFVELAHDAHALLKAQEPHIVTLDDYEDNPNVDKDGNLAVWRESRHFPGIAYHEDGWVVLNRNRVKGWFNSEAIRFWTSRPTDEAREATPWSEQDQREYQAAVEMAEYCERYEPTYNSEDGSM